jgi:hypothetical protein
LTEVDSVKKKIPADQLYEITYEKLLEQPQKELTKICDFIGEKYVPEMLEFYKNKSACKTDAQNLKNLLTPS